MSMSLSNRQQGKQLNKKDKTFAAHPAKGNKKEKGIDSLPTDINKNLCLSPLIYIYYIDGRRMFTKI